MNNTKNKKIKYEGNFLNGKWNGLGTLDETGEACEIYEGEFINGILNGKVNEYYFDRLQYEGEYLNGKRNGKGKVYNQDGIVIFEGEYLNGVRNGKGKKYNDKDILIFEGEYSNDKRNGKGKEYKENNELIFEGEYANDKRYTGTWKEYGNFNFADTLIYEGEYYKGNKWNGKFYDKNKNVSLILINGKGKGKIFEYGILKFEGEYNNGMKNGKGKEFWNDGSLQFEGEFLNDKRWNGISRDSDINAIWVYRNGNKFVEDWYHIY